MKISEFLQATAVIPELQGRDARAILTELSAPIAIAEGVPVEDLLEHLLAREADGATAVGEGVALPHARHPKLDRVTASFGRSRKGVFFDASDRKPVRFFFAVFTPATLPGVHLKALARASNVLRSSAVRDAILAAVDGDEIYRILLAAEA